MASCLSHSRISLTLCFVSPVTFKDPCDCIGPSRIIWHNLPIQCQLVSRLNFPVPCKVTQAHVRLQTSLGGGGIVLPTTGGRELTLSLAGLPTV